LPLKQTLKHVALRALAATERASEMPLSEVKNFLLLQHAAALGTVIHATPLIPALRAAVPDARIVVAASGFGVEIFHGNPGVTAVLPIPNPTQHPVEAALALRKTLPLDQLYATITTTGNERTWITLASVFAGAGNRVGFTLAPELYRTPLTFDPALSQIANNLRIVEALGHAPAHPHEPQVFFSEQDLAEVRNMLGSAYEAAKPRAVFVTQTNPAQR
jgi:ADP-heptose:LPS heptosyltransferase